MFNKSIYFPFVLGLCFRSRQWQCITDEVDENLLFSARTFDIQITRMFIVHSTGTMCAAHKSTWVIPPAQSLLAPKRNKLMNNRIASTTSAALPVRLRAFSRRMELIQNKCDLKILMKSTSLCRLSPHLGISIIPSESICCSTVCVFAGMEMEISSGGGYWQRENIIHERMLWLSCHCVLFIMKWLYVCEFVRDRITVNYEQSPTE